MQRLNDEMQALMVRALLAQGDRSRLITATPAFGQWIVKNADVLRASRA